MEIGDKVYIKGDKSKHIYEILDIEPKQLLVMLKPYCNVYPIEEVVLVGEEYDNNLHK